MKTSFSGNVISSLLLHMPCSIVLRPLQPYYRGLPFKGIPVCLRLQAKQSHMPHCRVTPHLLNFSTGHARRHTCKHTQCQWPRKWNWGEGWFESVFAFEKSKVKLSDLDLWKWRRDGGRDGRRKGKAGRRTGAYINELTTGAQKHDWPWWEENGPDRKQWLMLHWSYMLPQPCSQGFTFIPSSVNYHIAIWMDLLWRIVDACCKPDDAWFSQTTILSVAAQSKSLFFVLLYPFPKCCWLMLHPVHYQFHN